MLVKS
jgi:hypothetical protein